MSTLAVIGAQWGDEGKGKVVDVIAREAKVVARFSGGNNAGHTLVIGDKKIITHLVPSGCAYPGTLCVLGAGMVVDCDVLREELDALERQGLMQSGELRVSYEAHLILPYHRELDGLREDARRDAKIGTTRRGVGPAYEAKAARRGIKVRDLFNPELLRSRLELNRGVLAPEFERLGGGRGVDVEAVMSQADQWRSWLEPAVCDVGALVHQAVVDGLPVLFEGAQGALLDVDHGTYPFVTSTSTIAGAACSGLGIGPTLIDGVWGISKAYATRVGAGPFPTRVDGAAGDAIRRAGAEFGATTGRPRDCGWLDLPALRYAARLNGLTGLCVTKLDVLAGLANVAICVGYRDGVEPGRDGLEAAVPVYESISGWDDPALRGRLEAARRLADLPVPVRAYLDRVAEAVGVPITLVSVGPDREQTIVVTTPF
ncbi:MAG: adenylosuccinate synthase [Myxococcales bacterium FL481]|nr:MAG: adenylosuccinate synthase [Myxococcales bacterium FL481]